MIGIKGHSYQGHHMRVMEVLHLKISLIMLQRSFIVKRPNGALHCDEGSTTTSMTAPFNVLTATS